MKKCGLCMILVFTLIISSLYVPVGAEAAGKTRTIYYDLKLAKGQKQTYYFYNLGGYENIASLSVKTSKKKVAAVKKGGKKTITITGKSKGSARVTATVKLKKEYISTKTHKYIFRVKVYKPAATPAPTATPVPTKAPEATEAPAAD